MVAVDVHDISLVVEDAVGRGKPVKSQYTNDRAGRRRMLSHYRKRAKAARSARVVFAYEASSEGYGLYDDVTDAGFECHVLAPSLMPRSQKHRRTKTDRKDASAILEVLRAHILAGNKLPDVWIPDPRTRDDREVVRTRLDSATKRATIKTQVRFLLKRNRVRIPRHVGKSWSKAYRLWLLEAAEGKGRGKKLGDGGRIALKSYARQIEMLDKEIAFLDADIKQLARTPRYAEPVTPRPGGKALVKLDGVATFVAMIFLTEMGDLSRFKNRRQVPSYIGIVPSSNESGDASDRKGHITHQGSWRVRKALCQSAWARIRVNKHARALRDRLVEKNPKKKKIATVAVMRHLCIRMWHVGLEAQERAGCFAKDRAKGVAD
jgi:transposase